MTAPRSAEDAAGSRAPAAREGVLARWEGARTEQLARAWDVPRLEVHASLPSTNDRARELARAGAPPLTVVVAEEQTRGRGRGGRSWSSPSGLGLWMSLTLEAREPGEGVLVPMLAGLAVAGGVEDACPALRARIKWPNDVLVGGLKVAGILVEAWEGSSPEVASGLVLGIGVNVGQEPGDFPEELRSTAGSLEGLSGGPVSRRLLAGSILAGLRDRLRVGGGTLGEAALEELRARDALDGREVVLDDGRSGRALGMDRTGALRFQDASGAVTSIRTGGVRAKEDAGGDVASSRTSVEE